MDAKLVLRVEWNETVGTCRDPFDTKKLSNLSPEILIQWIAPYCAPGLSSLAPGGGKMRSSIEHGCLSAVFKIGSKFLIRIFFRTFYKNGFSELVKILVIILVFRIGFNAFHKNGYYDEKNFNLLIP